jgi:hypothetical protein
MVAAGVFHLAIPYDPHWRLTVNGQSYTQTFAVKPDPRAR